MFAQIITLVKYTEVLKCTNNKFNMMKKTDLIIYRVVTALFTLILGGSVLMYLFMHDMAAEEFTKLGIPTFIIYPLAMAKILGLIAIWTNKSKMLKEWAYAGFAVNLSLGVVVHLDVGDGNFAGALMALTLGAVSYFYYRKQYTVYAEA